MIRLFVLIGMLSALISVRAQDPCQDTAGLTRMEDQFDHYWSLKGDLEARRKAIASGEAFLEKYGNCPLAKERADWLRLSLPKMRPQPDPPRPDTSFVRAFDVALGSKDWDTLFSTGAKLLQRYPDDYRPVEIILGTAGYDELLHGDTRWADKTLTYAKLSITDLDAGKEFRIWPQSRDYYGVPPFAYKSREDATAWLNLIAGTINVLAKKDLSAAMPYLYRATLAPDTSDVAKDPKLCEMIGDFYLGELKNKGETGRGDQMAEQAMIAFARAFVLTTKSGHQDELRQNFITAYRFRWDTTDLQDVHKLILKNSSDKLIDPETLLTSPK